MLSGLEMILNCKDLACGKVVVKLESFPGRWVGRCPNPHCRKVILETKKVFETDITSISEAANN